MKRKYTKEENEYKSKLSKLKNKLKVETDKNEKLTKLYEQLKNEKIKTEKNLKLFKRIFFSFFILSISFIIFFFTKIL